MLARFVERNYKENMTNTTNITDNDIRQLGIESGQAGDHAQAMLCQLALLDTTLDEVLDVDDRSEARQIAQALTAAERSKIGAMTAAQCRAECERVIIGARAREGHPRETIRHGTFGPIVWSESGTRAATQRDMDTLPVGPDLTPEEEDEIEE